MRSARHKIGEAEAAAGRRARRAGHMQFAAGHAVEQRIGGREPRRLRVDRRRQRAVARRAVEVGGSVRLAFEGAAGEAGEAAQVARRDFEPSVQFLRREQARIAGVEVMRREFERIERHVAADGRRSAQGKLRLAADRARERRIGEPEAAHDALALEGDARRLLAERAVRDGAEVRGNAVERALLDMDVAGVERAFRDRVEERPDDRGVEVELADLGCAGNGAGVDLEADRIVRRLAAFDVEAGVGGDHVNAGRRDRAVVIEEEIAFERRLAGDDRPKDRGRHAFEARIEVERKLPPGALPRDDDIAPRPDIGAGGEIEPGLEIVERPCAVQGKLDRRQSGQVGEMGEDAARRFVGIDRDGELVGRRNVGHDRLERARGVEALCREAEVETFGRRPERRLALDLEARRDPDDRLAERKVLQSELLDDHLDRQFRQDRARPAVRRRRRLGPQRPPQELHVADRQLVNVEPATEQGKPVPDQADLVDLQPRALAVGEHNIADRGVGGQNAVHRPNRDFCRVRGQSPREQVGEDALVFLRRPRRRPKGEDREDQRRKTADGNETPHHQKACPMLT